ncbi:MAG: sulfurtransferase, rhodanese related [Actinomycetota bacterium]
MATEVTIDDLADAISHGAYVLDVREQEEYDEVHVPGVVLIPLGQLEDRINEVEDGSRVFVICRSGARSLKGADILEANGIDAVSVAGGTLGWIASGRATE